MTRTEFIPYYKTKDVPLLSILKFHLEEMEIPYFVTGEDFLFLENLAMPMHEACAILYLLPEDVDKFQKFWKKDWNKELPPRQSQRTSD